MRWVLRGSLVVLVAVLALAIESVAGRHPQGNMLALTAPFRSGFYGVETSATLPGPHGAANRTFHWTQPESSLALWPPLAGGGALELEYLNPAFAGSARLRIGAYAPLTVPATQKLRHLHLLLPPVGATMVRLVQTAPIEADGRQLGLLLSDLRWWATGPRSSINVFLASSRLLPGLPLTVALLALLLALLRLPFRWGLALTLALPASMAALAALRPWDSRAIQPILQALALYGIAGAGSFYLGRWVRKRSWERVILSVWAASSLLFFGPGISHDGAEYYAYVRSLFVDGDLRFDNELDPAQSPFQGTPNLASAPTRTGYTPNLASVGPALVWTPFWLLGHAITLAGRGLGIGWRADGYASPYIVLVMLASALAGLATMLGCFTIARRWFRPATAALAAITIYFGSNLLFYAQFQGSFAHSLSGATATWFFMAVLLLDEAPAWRRWLLLGATTGAMLLIYWITALLLVAPLIVVLRHGWRRARRGDWAGLGELGVRVLGAAGVALLVFTPQLLAWKIIYGDWLAIPHGGDYVTPGNIKLGSVLFAPLYGLAWWTPAYFVGLIGSVWFAIRWPWPGLVLFAALALYFAYNASLTRWFAGGAFGMRRFTAIAPIFAVGLAAIFNSLRRYPALPPVLAGVLIGWGLQMTARYLVHAIPHDTNVLMDLDLRALLLSREPLPLDAFVVLVRDGWFGAFVRAPNLGGVLILVGCALAVGAILLGWQRLSRRTGVPDAVSAPSRAAMRNP